jgi:hypothetical protein
MRDMETTAGIWPPYEAFYLESPLYCTHSALKSAATVRVGLECGRKSDATAAIKSDEALPLGG